MAHDFSEHFWMMNQLIVLNWFIVMNHSKVIHVNELNFSTRSVFLLLKFKLKTLLKYLCLDACICAGCETRDGCETGLLTWSLWNFMNKYKVSKAFKPLQYLVYLYCQYDSVVNILYTAQPYLRDFHLDETEILLWFFWSSEDFYAFPMCCSISSFTILIKCLNCFTDVSESAEFWLAWVVNHIL